MGSLGFVANMDSTNSIEPMMDSINAIDSIGSKDSMVSLESEESRLY